MVDKKFIQESYKQLDDALAYFARDIAADIFDGDKYGSSHEMVEFKRKECKIGVWKKKMYMGSMTGCWE
ncbi:hypothetical protein FACS1894137_17190 [Spirochaetia bacterium]|nr:hypothetical protein FACS1894137_17190 [Spirochaetia bacterium]